MRSLIKIIAVIFPSLILFFNCTETPPEVIEDRWILIDILDTQGRKQAEELVFFLHGKDEEGTEDIQTMKLEHIESQIQWTLNEEAMKRVVQGGESWFGSFSFVMPMGEAFLHGEYKASLMDKAGSASEYFWTLVEDHSPEELPNPPVLDIRGSELVILDKEERPWRLLFYRDKTLVYQQYIRSQLKWNIPTNIVETETDLYILYVDSNSLHGWKLGPF